MEDEVGVSKEDEEEEDVEEAEAAAEQDIHNKLEACLAAALLLGCYSHLLFSAVGVLSGCGRFTPNSRFWAHLEAEAETEGEGEVEGEVEAESLLFRLDDNDEEDSDEDLRP